MRAGTAARGCEPIFVKKQRRRVMNMKITRRDLFFAGGLSLLAGTRVFGHGNVAPHRAQSQDPRSPSARLLEALQRDRLPLTLRMSQ